MAKNYSNMNNSNKNANNSSSYSNEQSRNKNANAMDAYDESDRY